MEMNPTRYTCTLRIFLIAWLLALFLPSGVSAQATGITRAEGDLRQPEPENLLVFDQWLRWNNPGSMLIHHLNRQADVMYAERDRLIAALQTPEDWERRQAWVRKTVLQLAGPFPEKTPIRSRILDSIQCDGYRIEKIIFESFPDYWVPGCLFVPENAGKKVPAVLNVIGHNQESFRADLYQIIILNLVKKGIIVLAIDPPGQGEHVQVYDSALRFSFAGYSVAEHSYIGNQSFLSGISSARYFIWDGIRAIDYLCTRRDVDPERIGVTGFSGGGTITSYLGAIDERVKVAVPCSWSTASRRQLETKGAQDAESDLYRSLQAGITFEDLIELRAPKPTLLTFVTRDEYLSVQGAIEAYREAKNAYRAFGAPDMLQLEVDDSRHWMTLPIRERIYAFFIRHFGLNKPEQEEAVEVHSGEELQITLTGQIATSIGGRRIFDLHLETTSQLLDSLQKSRQDIPAHLISVLRAARTLSGFRPPDHRETGAFLNGRYRRQGYTVAKYALPGEGDYAVPFLLFTPDAAPESAGRTVPRPAVVYLHPDGKAAQAQADGEIGRLVSSGHVVAAVDVLGIGETRNTASRELADGYTAVLTGRSIPGIQAGDILRVVNYLVRLPEVDPRRTGIVAIGKMGIPALHAAAFDTSIRHLVLCEMPISYRSIAANRHYKIGLIPRENGGYWHPYDLEYTWAVPGVLTAYDLPDLIGSLAPRKVALLRPLDQMLVPADDSLTGLELAFPIRAYQYRQAAGHLRLAGSGEDALSLLKWCLE
jgi:cephalosporin-C deacetylase-like acetyl esterase